MFAGPVTQAQQKEALRLLYFDDVIGFSWILSAKNFIIAPWKIRPHRIICSTKQWSPHIGPCLAHHNLLILHVCCTRIESKIQSLGKIYYYFVLWVDVKITFNCECYSKHSSACVSFLADGSWNIFCQLCDLKFLPLASLCFLTQTHSCVSWIIHFTPGLSYCYQLHIFIFAFHRFAMLNTTKYYSIHESQ